MAKTNQVLATVAGAILTVGATGAAVAAPPGNDAASRIAAAGAANGASGGAIVVDWNRELLGVIAIPGAQPATVHPTRSFALLHLAIYDAVASTDRSVRPFLASVAAPPDARSDAAAASAAHAVLTALFPASVPAFDRLLDSELAALPAGRPTGDGIRVGSEVAARLLAARAGDGSAAKPAPFVAGADPGDYRPTPPAFPAPVFTSWGGVTPFVLDRGSQFRPAPPPALTSAAYAQALNEVESLGRDTSTTRTAEQTTIGRFWAPAIWNTWNTIAEDAVLAHHSSLEEASAVFAALDVTFADGAIAMYDAKYAFRLWRPVTAIQLADTDGNRATVGDPTWTPLAPTAPDPSYPGAHSTISAAGAAVLAAFFGDRDTIRVTSPALPGVVRTFDRYSAVATEAGLSRIFAGQHTRLDHEAGQLLGRDVAAFVLDTAGIGRADAGLGLGR